MRGRPVTIVLWRQKNGRQLVATTGDWLWPRLRFNRTPNGWDAFVGYWYLMYDSPDET